jgi:hypothetical protein
MADGSYVTETVDYYGSQYQVRYVATLNCFCCKTNHLTIA